MIETKEEVMTMPNKEEEEVLQAFITSLGANLKERTRIEYSKAFRKMRNDFGGLRPLSQDDVNNWLSRRKGSLNRALMKNWIEFMDFHVRIPRNRGTTPKKATIIMPREDQAQIIQYIAEHSKNDAYPIAIALTLECALRRDEVVHVSKSGFQFSKWKEDLLENRSSPCELIVKGKGDKERVVVVSKDLMIAILNYMDKVETDRLFNFSGGKLYRKFNRACKKLGFITPEGKPRYHPHSLRHTQSTQWYEKGVDIMEIRDRLGHVSVATTQLYINPNKELAIKRWKDSLKK